MPTKRSGKIADTERGRFVQPQAASELVGELEDLTSPMAVFLREC